MDAHTRIHDWLDGCDHATLPAIHQQPDGHSTGLHSEHFSCTPEQEPYKMSNSAYIEAEEHVETSRPHRRSANTQPMKKQPQRACCRSQAEITERQQASDLDSLSPSTTPILLPPISHTELDPLAIITANLDISTSSLSLANTIRSTQLTSASRNKRRGASSRTTTNETDGISPGKRTRSQSPVKRIVDLSAARPPIKYNEGTASHAVPKEIEVILKRFKRIFKVKMPLCLKASSPPLPSGL